MNACMISYSFYEIDYRVRRYGEALASQGHSMDVYALRREGLPRRESIHGVHLHRVQKRVVNERSPLRFLVRIMLFFLRTALIMSWRSVRRRPALIHVHNVPDFLVFTCLLPKLLGARVILDIHDILPEFYCQKFGIRPNHPLAKFLYWVEWLSVRFADHVIVANDLWRQKIIERVRISPQRITALLNYPDEAFFDLPLDAPPEANGTFRIIYPGTLSHLHGIDIAIHALARLKEHLPEARMDFYSSRTKGSPYFESLTRLAQELGVAASVGFHPAVPHQEMALLLRQSTVGVVPKRAGVFASEAFSTKIFEFMAAGLPAVASRTRIDEYYFDDSLICFFEPENAEDLARRLLELHNDPGKRIAQAHRARDFMADKRWELKKELYYDIVEQVVGRRVRLKEPARAAGVRVA